jgi:threonine dehydrogenase-like Zn-dependent dehydrogenase
MKAVCWQGKKNVSVERVPDPRILNPRDAIVRVTSTAICGSDLHLYNGFNPTMMKGDILGHEFMGEVVEVGSAIRDLRIGDRVIVPFAIACGNCLNCQDSLFSLCENSNPNAWMAEKLWGYSTCGMFGYSHVTGGYAGGQAEYVRVPFADVGAFQVENGLSDDQVLFLTDIFPTGYMAAENCDIQAGQTIAVWGAGPVGLFVIAIDRFPERLRLAREMGAETLNYEECDIREALDYITAGRGPDACIDAVGLEAHGDSIQYAYDRAKQAMSLETGRPIALREAILSCRNGGIVSVPGVYAGFLDKIPFGSVMNRSLTIRTGQTHVHRYVQPLLQHIEDGDIDPSFLITHHLSLDEAPAGYEIFSNKQDGCVKVVMHPN